MTHFIPWGSLCIFSPSTLYFSLPFNSAHRVLSTIGLKSVFYRPLQNSFRVSRWHLSAKEIAFVTFSINFCLFIVDKSGTSDFSLTKVPSMDNTESHMQKKEDRVFISMECKSEWKKVWRCILTDVSWNKSCQKQLIKSDTILCHSI